jgi:CBS domain-containing membrane protein
MRVQRKRLGLDRAREWARNLLGKDFDFSHAGPGVGGAIAIGSVLLVSRWCLGLTDAALLVASMGASAVLLFGVPEGALSRPWSVFGGHVISAFIGVGCAWGIPDPSSAAPLAVGLAIVAMSVCRCTHPPGGATALSAVIGGPAVHEMGIQYVFTPVLLNACVMLTVAWLFHLPTERYPILPRRTQRVPDAEATAATLPNMTAPEL